MTTPPEQPRWYTVRDRFLRGLLKVALGLAVLIALVYLEEDWRGAQALASTKAKWEALGESFDSAKFVPSAVPDNQNLAALPLFEVGDEKDQLDVHIGLPNLKKALHAARAYNFTKDSVDLPPTGNWQQGELTDMGEFHSAIAKDYALVFKGQAPPSDLSAQFDALFPFAADLRGAAATRSAFRLNCDYSLSLPTGRPLGAVTEPIELARVMALDAVLALHRGQPDAAMGDIRANYVIQAGLGRDPSWVGGIVAISLNAITTSAVFRGLAHHQWSDAQLTELEQLYDRNDFLATGQWALRCDVLDVLSTFQYYKKAWRGVGGPSAADYIPGGWWDQNAADATDFLLGEAQAIDPKGHRFFANVATKAAGRVQRLQSTGDTVLPWEVWAFETEPITKGLHTYPQAQVWSDETRIACALERYRLAHGSYPQTLDALAPASIDAVPRDIMNGAPYHYRLKPDGTFLLYSVGWDQVDDQGDAFWETDHPEVQDYAHGDWVWPTAKN